MEKLKVILLFGLVIIPTVIVFKNFFDLSNPLVWGDAPFFYSENLKELFNKPYVWDVRNSNLGNSQASILWLFIPTFLMGLLHYLFNLSHEIAVRIVFFFPFIIFSLAGIQLIFKKLTLSNLAKAFGSLLYLLNTYILVVIDGGQIGVVLSYGIFPLAFYTFMNLLEKNSLRNFFAALIMHFLIFNSDLRIALILIFFELVWLVFLSQSKVKQVALRILGTYVSTVLISGLWAIPFIDGFFNAGDIKSSLTESNFIKLTNSFYLFQPHFPDNDFGNLSKTPIYFLFLPLILLISLLLNFSKRVLVLTLMYLLFVFLAKGSNPPFGSAYDFFINSIPLGSAFRDSSKFYIPMILTSSLLIGFSVDTIRKKISRFKYLWIGLIYILLLVCISPALFGNLTGILGKNPNKSEFSRIHDLVLSAGEFRTLWFGEKPPVGYADWNHPALAANLLYQERPFASMIKGEYDKFYFLHNKNISQWFELLGIKYIFYPANFREKSLTQKEKSERLIFENFISKVPNLSKVNIQASFPIYKTKNPLPKIFAQEKILFVVGGEEIYQRLFSLNNFSLEKNALVFLESCKFDSEIILNINPESYGLITTGDKKDLYMSFFCKNLISTADSLAREWSINDSGQYLIWKSQLLERGVENYDFDFGKGLAYSTNTDEKLKFKLTVNEEKGYYLALRYLTASESGGLRISWAGTEQILKNKNSNKLQWELVGPLSLKKGDYNLDLTNLGGLVAVNTLGLIPKDEYDNKSYLIGEKLKYSHVFKDLDDPALGKFLGGKELSADYSQTNPTEYKVNIPKGAGWLVFSERFDQNWKLQNDTLIKDPIPFYSMLNGYYISDISGGAYTLYYRPQKSVDWGLLLTLVTVSLVCFAAILHIILKDKHYGSFKKYFRNPKN